MNLPPKKRLGRGLDGLLPPAPPAAPATQNVPVRAPTSANVADLHPNRDQPRRHFEDETLEELAASIRELGVLEPIVVRKRATGGYEIISGERRWRAAQRAGVLELPIHLVDLGDEQAYLASLVENLQREDLRPLEVARGYQRLVDDFSLTQEQIAHRVGKSRVSVSNSLRLLKLPGTVLSLLDEGKLSEGHGRALLQASSPKVMEKLAREAVDKGYSVREVERRARSADSAKPGKDAGAAAPKSANVTDLEKRISMALGMTTRIEQHGNDKGRVSIDYGTLDDLDRLISRLFG